jgi:hypothetical protein
VFAVGRRFFWRARREIGGQAWARVGGGGQQQQTAGGYARGVKHAHVGGVGVVVGASRECRALTRDGVKFLRWGGDLFDLRAREWWVHGRLRGAGRRVVVVPVETDALTSQQFLCVRG